MLKCDSCNGLHNSNSGCFIQNDMPHLFFGSGCAIHQRTFNFLYEYFAEKEQREHGVVIGYCDRVGEITRKYTPREIKRHRKQDLQYRRTVKKLEMTEGGYTQRKVAEKSVSRLGGSTREEMKAMFNFQKGDKVRIYDSVLTRYFRGVIDYTTPHLVICKGDNGRVYAESWADVAISETVRAV